MEPEALIPWFSFFSFPMAGRVGGGWAREPWINEPSRGVFEGWGGLFS